MAQWTQFSINKKLLALIIDCKIAFIYALRLYISDTDNKCWIIGCDRLPLSADSEIARSETNLILDKDIIYFEFKINVILNERFQ